MFTLLSGPFHPYLEGKLVDTVLRVKFADPQASLAIVVPSESLRRRLQWLVCVEHGIALFDTYFFTFHQLALRLDAERRLLGQSDISLPSIELVDDFFHEYLLNTLLLRDAADSISFTNTSGLGPALWRTIQDLQEAQVDPRVGLTGLQEGVFDEASSRRLQELFQLQATYQIWSQQLRVGMPDDLTRSIIPWVSQSGFMAKLSSVFYYGFYDLTQVQLSLLESVASATTVTVFFPLLKGEGSGFAQRFLDRHLLKAGVVHQTAQENGDSKLSDVRLDWNPNIHVVNAVGPEGEISFICKSILRHKKQSGYASHEIGVVARNLDLYSPHIARHFDAHGIPFCTTATRPLLEEPLTKVWWKLAGLRARQYGWGDMLDIVTSPWYRRRSQGRPKALDHAHIWVHALRYFRIVGGEEDWARFANVVQNAAAVQEWQQASGSSETKASEAIQELAEIVSGLIIDCQNLPQTGSLSELAEAFLQLLEAHILMPTEDPTALQNGESQERTESLLNALEYSIECLHQLNRIDRHVTWEEWSIVFRSLLERGRLPLPGQTSMGVQILDVMAARGRPFQIIFILGINDQVFPRVVREDALLLDRDRKTLAESLGYKIDEKMTGFDEEALLFELLRRSAREVVYFLYQRADGKGRALIPSSLLQNDLLGGRALSVENEEWFPVGICERHHGGAITSDQATPQEIRLCAVLEGRSIQPKVFSDSPWWKVFRNGMDAIVQLEDSGSEAGPFDGLTAVHGQHWEDLLSRGFSPSSLGMYAQCPMRYWMNQVVKAQRMENTMSKELPGRVWGELVHRSLCDVYQHITAQGWPSHMMSSDKVAETVQGQVDRVFQDYARIFGTGYWIIWDWIKTRIQRMVVSLLERDQREFRGDGWVPYQFEREAVGSLHSEEKSESEIVPIHGRLDRIDRARLPPRVRIVDYKVTMRRSSQAKEKDLVTQALQGRQLQPPLYSLMTSMNPLEGREEGEQVMAPIESVNFLYLQPLQQEIVRSATFPKRIWNTSTGDQIKSALQDWVQGIREGKFFILPGLYCETCSYASACRLHHFHSRSRAYRLPSAKTFRRIRKQKAIND